MPIKQWNNRFIFLSVVANYIGGFPFAASFISERPPAAFHILIKCLETQIKHMVVILT